MSEGFSRVLAGLLPGAEDRSRRGELARLFRDEPLRQRRDELLLDQLEDSRRCPRSIHR
jgi:hypothetical protein